MFDDEARPARHFVSPHMMPDLGTVIMGIWDEDGITDLLQIPEDQELAALIAIGHPDIDPDTP